MTTLSEAGPRPGDFGLTRGVGAAMLMVRFGTFSRYGHAAVCVGHDLYGQPVIIEAMPGGARRRSVGEGEFIWSNIPLSDYQRGVITRAAESTVGIPYDWRSIAGFVARFWKVKLWAGTSADHADDRLICSELVVWSYRQGGIDLAPGVAAGDVSPGDLANYLVLH